MFALIRLLTGSLIILFRSRASLAAEIMALRHQLGVYHRTAPARPHLARIRPKPARPGCQTWASFLRNKDLRLTMPTPSLLIGHREVLSDHSP